MAWETRERGGRYYTRSRKIGGRVVREYIGTGPVAELIATRDAEARVERTAEARVLRAERDRLAPAEAVLAELDALTELLAHAALVAAGYRRHHRGAWRKRRGHQAET